VHPFEPNGGISGVAVLAESHISVHTWPELRYAAFDVFMCGAARPERCIEVLLEAFSPRRVAIEELLRGSAV
jgi:S-adenosylmethionine decarboxylase